MVNVRGTGLVGEALSQTGFTRVDGADISTGMLEQAAAKLFFSMQPYNAGNFFGTDQFEKRRLLLTGGVAMAFMNF